MFEVLGVSAVTIALFVGFGVVVGTLFGFFGMGGSFLVTPTLLVLDFDPAMAVGSGLAFVFGTAVVGTLSHRERGQVDARLGIVMLVGTTPGVFAGQRAVFALRDAGYVDAAVSAGYIALLLGIGTAVSYEARQGDSVGSAGPVATRLKGVVTGLKAAARGLRSLELPPRFSVTGGGRVSLWTVLGVAFLTGFVSGLLGIGGGFVVLPALVYVVGIPAQVAVGTALFEITFSGGVGSFLYARLGSVDLAVVAPLLAGSVLGSRLGSAATALVDEDDVKALFGALLLVGGTSVAARAVADTLGLAWLRPASVVALVLSAVAVAAVVLGRALLAMRTRAEPVAPAD